MPKSLSSSVHTTSGYIKNSPGLLYGIMVAGRTSTRTHYLRDGGSTGTIVCSFYALSTDVFYIDFPDPIAFSKSIYLAHGGTNHVITVLYS
ncbi:MAG: hypothetical protein JW726_15075 [Anaerolineales bacterium]|nr:hypothetical protein [Anaerolineales bacterium]